jgi:hypothetical protein
MMMPIQTAGLNQLPQRLNAHGSAMSQTLRNIAGAVGTALFVTLFSNAATARGKEMILEAQINPEDPANAAQVLAITQQATVDGINFAFAISTWMTAAALVLAFFIRKTKPAEESSVGIPVLRQQRT